MASHPHLDDEDDFGGDYAGNQSSRRPGNKRSFGDLDDDDDDIFGSKKGKPKVEESVPGVTTGMILSLRESLQNCKDTLATCETAKAGRWELRQLLGVAIAPKNSFLILMDFYWHLAELEATKSELQKWHVAFQNESAITTVAAPEPAAVVNYLQNLKSSEESLREQLEKAKKKEAAFIVTFAKRDQENAELKSLVRDLKAQLKPPLVQAKRLLLDPAIHEEFTRLKNLVEEKDKKVKELQDNVAAVNFTPQSKMGKMLMAKCRTLQEENEEVGQLHSEGKIHELTMKLALQKSQNMELRGQLEGVYKYMDELTNDVEKSNEMVVILQRKLEEKDVELKRLREECTQKEPTPEENDSVSSQKAIDDETLVKREIVV